MRPSCSAAWRILRPSGGVKLRVTPPFGPASCTSLVAMPLASVMGTLLRWEVAFRPFDFAYSTPNEISNCPSGTLAPSTTTFFTPRETRYCTAPSVLYSGPMFTAAMFGVKKHSLGTPATITLKPCLS